MKKLLNFLPAFILGAALAMWGTSEVALKQIRKEKEKTDAALVVSFKQGYVEGQSDALKLKIGVRKVDDSTFYYQDSLYKVQ